MKRVWISMLAMIMFIGMIGIISAQADSIAPSVSPESTDLTVIFGTAPVFSQETTAETFAEEGFQEGTTSEEDSEGGLLDESTTTTESESSYQESVVPGDITMNEATIPNTQRVERSQASGVAAPSAQITPVPEPSTLLLIGIGMLGLLGWYKQKKA